MVLILVLVEDGLRVRPLGYINSPMVRVLILVLVEDGLRVQGHVGDSIIPETS